MKFPLPADTLPTLALSADDQRKLADAAEVVVTATVFQYHEHLTIHQGVVDERRWKKIKQREDVRVYRERKSGMDESSSSSSAASSHDSVVKENELKVMSPMLTFGTIQGNLDEIMYGVLNPSVEEMQLKSAYVGDGFVDWALLASIIKPSEQDPFRELSIKWTVKGHPLLVGAIMRTRDTLYIESIGIAVTPSGERIGYHLQHSVDIPECPELLKFQIVRAKISFCHLFRQRKENCVEVFIRGYISPMGDAPASLAAVTSAEVSVSVWKNLHCSEMKKLTRILTARHRTTTLSFDTSSMGSSSGSRTSVALMSMSSVRASSSGRSCALCLHSLGGGFSFTSSKEKHCRVCSACVCSRCRVSKTMHLATERLKALSSTNMTFCTRCLLDASCASSATFAVLDALAAEGNVVDYTKTLVKHNL